MHERLWERFLAALEGRLPPQALDTWIRPGRLLALRDNHLEIGVPSKFMRTYVVEHYLSDLHAAAEACLGPRAHVSVTLDRPAVLYQGHYVWGLTYRLLAVFFEHMQLQIARPE